MKICFSSQINRVPDLPQSYKDLEQTILSVCSDELPSKWTLSYVDPEGDQIMLKTEEDYRVMLETLPKEAIEALKVYVVPVDDNNLPIFNKSQQIMQSSQNARAKGHHIKEDSKIEEVHGNNLVDKKNEENSDMAGSDSNNQSTEFGRQTQLNEEEKEDGKIILQRRIQRIQNKLNTLRLSQARREELSAQMKEYEERLQRRIEAESRKAKKANKKILNESDENKQENGTVNGVLEVKEEEKQKEKEKEKKDSKEILRGKIQRAQAKLADDKLPETQKEELLVKLQEYEEKLQRWMQKEERKNKDKNKENNEEANGASENREEEKEKEKKDSKEILRGKIQRVQAKLANDKLPENKKEELLVKLKEYEERLQKWIRIEERRAKKELKMNEAARLNTNKEDNNENKEEEKEKEKKDSKEILRGKIQRVQAKLANDKLSENKKEELLVKLKEYEERLQKWIRIEERRAQRELRNAEAQNENQEENNVRRNRKVKEKKAVQSTEQSLFLMFAPIICLILILFMQREDMDPKK